MKKCFKMDHCKRILRMRVSNLFFTISLLRNNYANIEQILNKNSILIGTIEFDKLS